MAIKEDKRLRILDVSNKRFGKLIAIDYFKKNGRTYWNCVCDCGNKKSVVVSQLTSGRSKSCGCLRKENGPKCNVNRLEQLQKYLFVTNLKRRSREMGFNYHIDFNCYKEIIMKKCHYCERDYSTVLEDWKSKKVGGEKISDIVLRCNGIDRVDNTKGYIEGNIVPCCKYCNFAKSDMTLLEFENWIKRIYKFQTREN